MIIFTIHYWTHSSKFHPRYTKLNKDNSQSEKYIYMTYYSFLWIFLHILWFITIFILVIAPFLKFHLAKWHDKSNINILMKESCDMTWCILGLSSDWWSKFFFWFEFLYWNAQTLSVLLSSLWLNKNGEIFGIRVGWIDSSNQTLDHLNLHKQTKDDDKSFQN
jgi:uncharacterized membrane protein